MRSTQDILKDAVCARRIMRNAREEEVNLALRLMAKALVLHAEEILEANRLDVMAAADKISPVMIDRLTLTEARIRGMAEGILEIAALPYPVGRELSREVRPNGLVIRKVSAPMGVVAIIYESRPNVTSDAAALSLKSGNVCVLRGGKEAYRSSAAIVRVLRSAVSEAGLSENAIQLIEDTTRESATELMRARGFVDLLIPRGGAGLIRACVENATVPCLETGTGICHIYVDRDANTDMALKIIENAKCSRPSVCNAAEVCLVHRDIAADFLPRLEKRLTEEQRLAGRTPVELRCDGEALGFTRGGVPVGECDFDTEFLDYILAVRVVGSTEEAIAHIEAHSTGHSEAIITDSREEARKFTAAVDSAAVYVNASTRFTDGGEFGLGCEMGISTQKLHARGPMGISELTTYKYLIEGTGQTR